MKAIISHDINHITVSEHLLRDLSVPKFLLRSNAELLMGKIAMKEYMARWTDFFKDKWQNIDELVTYNNVKQIPSSFFVGVNKGFTLNYSNAAAVIWMEQVINRGCELNLYGINFEEKEEIKNERELFFKLSKLEPSGIRIHNLHNNQSTLFNLNAAGYKFDSTMHAFENPYKVGDMWEMPFQIMDGWIIENGKKWQSSNFSEAKERTKKQIEKAQKHHLKYLGIVFHDRYFSNSFKTWLDWYFWLTEYLDENKIEFINFKEALAELNESEKKEYKLSETQKISNPKPEIL